MLSSERSEPSSLSRLSRRNTAWVVARLPAVSKQIARSSPPSKVCIFEYVLIWSTPALVRESEANTNPWSTLMARQ